MTRPQPRHARQDTRAHTICAGLLLGATIGIPLGLGAAIALGAIWLGGLR